ncbi:hypothetical protein BDZ45DRAFT_748815 [Acephala macrosclerotiorum]|nr:hypothetical protein BDZ45DRAFT_748815 [Acephala macrosclerotiorum]
MTIELCAATCIGSIYFGVEYASQCFCGNDIVTTGPPQYVGLLATDGRCNMPCTGNSTEICGGAGGLNVYTYNSNFGSTTNTSSTASSVSSTALALVPSPRLSTNTQNTATSTSSTLTTSSPSTLATSTILFNQPTPTSSSTTGTSSSSSTLTTSSPSTLTTSTIVFNQPMSTSSSSAGTSSSSSAAASTTLINQPASTSSSTIVTISTSTKVPIIPSPSPSAIGSYEQTAWYFDGCFAPNLNTQFIVGIAVYSNMAGIYDNICFCASSMQAFTLTQGIGSTTESCAATCVGNPGVACNGVLAIGITTIVPLLPLPPGLVPSGRML